MSVKRPSREVVERMEAALEVGVPLAAARQNGHAIVYSLAELFALRVTPRPYLLEPILRERDLGMIFAWRGVGKTHIAHGLALAVATGGEFLRWHAPKPNEVLLVDGEMPMGALQDRLRGVADAYSETLDTAAVPFRVLAADAQDEPLPTLSSRKGQMVVEEHIGNARLLILDNISTLLDIGDENESDNWSAAQSWLLHLRRNGIAVLLIHHTGKSGAQRGTSRREDILDLSIALRRPAEYRASEGARFEVIFEKARHLHGPDAESFEARLDVDEHGRHLWTMKDPTEWKRRRALDLLKLPNMTIRDVAQELGVPKSTVADWKRAGLSIEEQVAERIAAGQRELGSDL